MLATGREGSVRVVESADLDAYQSPISFANRK